MMKHIVRGCVLAGVLAVCYGGRDEITDAVRRLAR